MPNPFPGIDPYIEAQYYWPDFHHQWISECSYVLGGLLPDQYEARIDEQVRVVDLDDEEPERPRDFKPDVAVIARATPFHRPDDGGVAVLEEVEVDLEPSTIQTRGLREVREKFIKILRREDRSMVTVIELLSPENKSTTGLGGYLHKRNELSSRPIHLVELDFLAGGHRLPMGDPLPPGDAFAIVSRWDRRPDAEVYAWSVRRRLPRIKVPLKAPDPDLTLGLAEVYAAAYERGRYDRSIDRARPLRIALGPEDLA